MPQTIPLQAIANQAVICQLNGQNTQINVRQKWTGLFVDIYVNDVLLLAGCIGRNLKLMFMNGYLGFVGDLTFVDTQGASDPNYGGLGSRYQLVYLLPSEIPPTYPFLTSQNN